MDPFREAAQEDRARYAPFDADRAKYRSGLLAMVLVAALVAFGVARCDGCDARSRCAAACRGSMSEWRDVVGGYHRAGGDWVPETPESCVCREASR